MKTKIKNSFNDLALMGGLPLFRRELHVGCPDIGDRNRFILRVHDILDRKILTNNGQYLCEFEERVAKASGVKHCVAVCNGTVGLELLIRALELKGEVILPSLTFVATAHALLWLGIKPVFCDIDPETLCIDPQRVKKLIGPKTSGIMGVHLFGRVCEFEALEKISHEHGLKLFFDAAHAFGCTKNGKCVGCFGSAEVLSFHATKVVNAFEGGAILTNDDVLAEKLKAMRNFGFKGLDNVVGLGTNAKMSEISAAMGLTSLERFVKNVSINERNYHVYNKHLSSLRGISVLPYDLSEKNNFQYVVLRVDKKVSGLSRDALLRILRAENILARRYFYPGCHRMKPYSLLLKDSVGDLPITNDANNQLMQLPTGSSVKPEDLKKICDLIQFCMANSQEITKQLSIKFPQESF